MEITGNFKSHYNNITLVSVFVSCISVIITFYVLYSTFNIFLQIVHNTMQSYNVFIAVFILFSGMFYTYTIIYCAIFSCIKYIIIPR